ncbi:MAG: DUF4258 domain-containing protein [Bacteroidia bacterium]|nr:DUF4258 domain-containing protein [Bacteroidia bacterium]
MKRGFVRFFIILAGVLLAALCKQCLGDDSACDFPNRNHTKDLVYSRHAKCRMDCRKIGPALVEDVYQYGEVNCAKSGKNKGEMRYALEKEDALTGDKVRIIIADDQDKHSHVVVTVIRLDKEFPCNCD